MSILRMTEAQYLRAWHHMYDEQGEHFVFFLCHWTMIGTTPFFIVDKVILIPDEALSRTGFAYFVELEAILEVINVAVVGQYALIEAHNHGGLSPRFSKTDREGFESFPHYVHESLPNRPYAATVWGNSEIYGEYFLPDGQTGQLKSITVVSNAMLKQVVSSPASSRFPFHQRQLAWFGAEGQQQLANLTVAIVGCGGTGSHIIQNLVYLGCRKFVLIDNDVVDGTNMNRLVTATLADLGTPKTILGRRLIRSVASDADVNIITQNLSNVDALDAVKSADVIWGCVDNDGARLILNDVAVAYRIPYIDVATGIHTNDNHVSEIGGRVAVVMPDSPCLNCMYEIDQEEASYFLAPVAEQNERLHRGYITGVDVPAPSVVSLNATVSAIAVNEFACYVSRIRPINMYIEYNLIDETINHIKQKRRDECVTCSFSGKGDRIDLERYVV